MKKVLRATVLLAMLFLLAKVTEYASEYYTLHWKPIELKRRW